MSPSQKHVILAAGLASMLSAPVMAQDVTLAFAELSTAEGAPAGTVELNQTPNGVLVVISLTGMTPGERAIHLHETGSCAPDFSAAGDHFSPDGKQHGFTNPDGPHAGDLPNIFVSVDGTAAAHVLNQRISLSGDGGLLDEDGAAVIVHEFADTYGEDAGAGGRVACGVIEASS